MCLDEVPINREWMKDQLLDSPPNTYLEELEALSEETDIAEKAEMIPHTCSTS